MDLDQLKRFLTAAELGNLSKAAREFNITQPALTQSIKALEASLGHEVFIRGGRGLKLTPFGALLVPRAQLIVNEINRIRDDAAAQRAHRHARIVIGVAPYLDGHIFPAVIDRLLARMPRLAVSIVEGNGADLARLLVGNEIDVGFCGANEVYAIHPFLKFDPLLPQRYVPAARAGHPVFRRRTTTDRDLNAFRWVIHDHRLVEERLHRLFETLGVPPPVDIVRTQSLSVIRSLALGTDSIAIFSTNHIAAELRRGELKALSFSGFSFESWAGLLYRRDVVKTPAMKHFMADLSRACAAQKV
ncbi:MAG: LysR family transcriptional regulator [Rhodospirillaceae bacterium]|nr:LysR family transcriptional regulator [Rhodospirillaceae bacterium]